jgi:hypothetical protein
VRVPEAGEAGAVADVGRVRIALLVGVRMVLAVVGDPVHDGPLERHRAGHGERVLRRLVRLEAAMGEHAVVADGHAEAADQVHDGEDRQIRPVDPAVPQQDDRCKEADERDDHADEVRNALSSRHSTAGWRARPELSCGIPGAAGIEICSLDIDFLATLRVAPT